MRRKKESNRINWQIKVPVVRVIKEDGEQAGILRIEEAIDLAQEAGLDLVEMSPNADPPVCKVMNYGKYKFQQAKKAKDAKAKQKQIQVKEVKFKPRIDEHDFKFKCNHIRRFIKHGDKVRAFVHFRGREVKHREIGMGILDRIIEETQDIGVVEKRPGMEGNQLVMYLIAKEPPKAKPDGTDTAKNSGQEAPEKN
ncbi:MAG: translation initiation factor IF-3 [Acidobacteriota bacterium]|nr:translation initiation factor IF-3 [Acidobacteriota bacterium]